MSATEARCAVCQLPEDATYHKRKGRRWDVPQHPFYLFRYPRCVQCGAVVRTGGKHWRTGAVSCSDCYHADWGTW